jgi:hypothetical protein
MTDELLTIDDIAALYKCKPRTARDVIVKQPWFPQPAKGSGRKLKRWWRSDVIRAAKQKEKP